MTRCLSHEEFAAFRVFLDERIRGSVRGKFAIVVDPMLNVELNIRRFGQTHFGDHPDWDPKWSL